jgi:ferredoxin
MAQQYPDMAERPAQPAPIRIVVDLNRCQSYAQCCFLAPRAFKLHGEEALWYDPAPDEAQSEPILRAAAACPVQAILVEWPEAAGHKKTEESYE